MRAFRVFPHLSGVRSGEPGHADFVPQGQAGGRLDNPSAYSMRYLAESPAGAVAERFGELDSWIPSMFLQRRDARLALATFEVPQSVRVLDMDDAQVLLDRGLRPTQIVRRDHEVTQAWALRVFEERTSRRGRSWNGIRWWSWYRPEWPVLGLWSGDVEVIDVQRLDLKHAAVREAAEALGRPLS